MTQQEALKIAFRRILDPLTLSRENEVTVREAFEAAMTESLNDGEFEQ